MINILGNPLKTYKKANGVFKFPNLKFYIGKCRIRNFGNNKLFSFWIDDLVWENHDIPWIINSPVISLTFFGKFQLLIEFQPDHMYWEQLLWYTYYCNKDINNAKEYWPWRDENNKSTWTDKYLV